MSNFTLDVPDDLLTAARQIAQATSQPIEQVLLSRLKTALPLPMLRKSEVSAILTRRGYNSLPK